jgi:hypothetical protein
VVVAVAQDAGGPDVARPWIRPTDLTEQYPPPILDLMGWDAAAWAGAAPPEYPCLIDERHRVSLLYGMVNVPTAVWIDEDGRIVRPPEPAGVSDAFRAIDLASFSMPPDAAEAGATQRNRYLAAVRDWVHRGADSPAALSPDEVARRMGAAGRRSPEAAAAAHFRVAEALYRRGELSAARHHFGEAARLRPDSWAYQRQARQLSDPAAVGELDAGPDYWAAVAALGDEPYYPPIELS